MAVTVGAPVHRSASVGGRDVSWSEVTITFDATSDPCNLTINATNFPALSDPRYVAAGRVAWLRVLRANNTSATGTFTPFIDSTTRRIYTMAATSAGAGHQSDADFGRGPLPVEVTIGEVWTVDKGEAGGAGAGTITIGIGPLGDV